jgi:hypothetical protein
MNEKKLSTYKYITFYTVIVLLLFVLIYLGLLPFTLYSNGFRFWIIVIIAVCALPPILKYRMVYRNGGRPGISISVEHKNIHKVKGVFYTLGLLLIIFICMGISTWPVFNSSRYRNLMQVNESEGFSQNIEEISKTKVPIVDKSLAFRLGDKKLGEYKGLGSQFTVNNYTMIEMKGELYWVGALEYTGFFKWLSNKDEGVPGYIMINATNTADVKMVDYKMKYVPSAYFGQDLMRKIYFSGNMGKLFSDYTAFELDEDGHPYYVKTVLQKKFAFSSGEDAVGVVVLDAVSGDVRYYDKDEAPEWIDRIQPQKVIINQLGYYGKYVHGYFNTLFAKKEVLQVSEGYSYIYNNGEFYLYTGLTSVGSDESIVGFTLTNMRTKETIFYRIGGATEYSAQKSAEGAVQDLGYTANWPILVNFKNNPTYFMTLKDQEGLIKKYAYVNVKDYSVFGIGNTLLEAQSNYLKNLGSSNTNPNSGANILTIESTIKQIVPLNIEGTSYYYIVLDDNPGKLFISSYSVSYEIPLSKVGDSVTIKYYESGNNIFTIEQFDNQNLDITNAK